MHVDVEQNYPDYLRDESRLTGKADSIAFPGSEEDVIAQLAGLAGTGRCVTIQGARTGIAGGAVPRGGHIVNLRRMNRVPGLDRDANGFTVRVQPGILLSELRTMIAEKKFPADGWSAESRAALEAFRAAGPHFFPPDPTETGAALGGMVAANASGARSFFYGPTRQYVQSMRVVLADGAVLALVRGREKAVGRTFSLETDTGRTLSGTLPGYAMPAVKNAAGYYARDNMDLADLWIGSEGTLGIISEIGLRLLPAPGAQWGVMMFLPSEEQAVEFVKRLRGERPAGQGLRGDAARLVAVEFFDHRALDLLRRQKATNPAFREIPAMPAAWHTGIYAEYHGDSEPAVEAAVMEMSALMAACGGDEETTWLASDEREMDRLKDFRHAVPEAVNLMIDRRRKTNPDITKLGTDLAVPDAALGEMLRRYDHDLEKAGLDYVKFGHIGDNHLHVNILPEQPAQYEQGKALYLQWARAVVDRGGTVSAEHGIGKLKTAMLEVMYGAAGVAEMRALKRVFDPLGRLNPGNLFDPA